MKNKNSLQIVSIRAKANNKYVSAWLDDKEVTLIADVDHKKAWEKFQLINNEDGSISFKAINGKYVSAWVDDKEVPLIAKVDYIGKWEKFQLINNEDGLISLKAANEKYVSIKPERDENTRLIAQATEITNSEHFEYESEDMTYKSSKVLNYLYLISGFKTIAGQHNQESKNEKPFDPALSTNNTYKITGKYPALWSGDFLYQQAFTTPQNPNRWKMIEEAKRQWEQGSIVNIMWHSCPPTQSEPCNWDGGVLSHLSDQEWNELTSEGTTLNNEWKSRLDNIAEYLRSLKESGVEVLWRPFHEMNQGKFWWGGRLGPNGTQKLYKITYDYLVKTKGLTNLIWVWDVQDFPTLSQDLSDYNPGDSYWDIIALDFYQGNGFTTDKYYEMVKVAGHKLIAIGECQRFPTISELNEQPRWLFFMGWAEDVFKKEYNSQEEISQLYNASNILTRDQLALLIRGMNF